MKKEEREIVKLSAREILFYLVDANVFLFQLFDKHRLYRKSIKDYWRWRENDHIRFSQNIYRLKTQKLIRIYKEGKEKYLELTPKGLEKLKKITIDELKITPPKKWDKKWRIVIFDIPDDKKVARNILREKLENLGFLPLQESVFIYPFESKKEIDYISDNYYVRPYVKYILADIFEGDEDLVEEFLGLNILQPKMMK